MRRGTLEGSYSDAIFRMQPVVACAFAWARSGGRLNESLSSGAGYDPVI